MTPCFSWRTSQTPLLGSVALRLVPVHRMGLALRQTSERALGLTKDQTMTEYALLRAAVALVVLVMHE
jgi:hypothetical protein